MSSIGPDALDYLAGSALDFGQLPPPSAWSPVVVAARQLERVRGVGVPAPSGQAGGPGLAPGPSPLSEPFLAGLAGESIPLAFQVTGGVRGVSFAFGTWVGSPEEMVLLGEQQGVVASLLDAQFNTVDRSPAGTVDLSAFPVGGIAHGIPRFDAAEGGPAPWDRLLRSMRGAPFSVLVLAEPIDPRTVSHLRNLALEDVRSVATGQEAALPSPLTRIYSAQINMLVNSLNRALSVGAWRTAVYLLGDRASYWRLAAAWRATFADAETLVLPLRTAVSSLAARVAAQWAMPYQAAPAGPRQWRHPFLNQTLLDSRQLAAIAHLPRLETSGFAVRPVASFAVSRPSLRTERPVLDLGDVMDQRTPTGNRYVMERDQLTRHVFVCGLTGAGKTNTIMRLLGEAAAADIPFLVIEPAKTEYREMLGWPEAGRKIRVFTVGRESVAPLRLNPFEVPPGIDVSTHLDLLKTVFMGSMALWIPLPQVLEQSLIELYTERGWSFSTGARPAGEAEPGASAAPTLGDLVAAVERIVPTLGFKGETTQEITAALTTRLNALRRGARGLMLDVGHSVPMGELLRAPTIIELEGLGDDGDKAFVMGLLLTRLYEHRRAEHARDLEQRARAGAPLTSSSLRHLVVVEEAHRLISAARKTTDAWHADPQGAFTDTFSQMLAEVRAYGQGIVVADQVPVRLAPDVIKNTNLKVVHRLVAGDDRAVVAAAMSMSAEQSKQLAMLAPGRAAVFSEGDHTPVIVQVPQAKDTAGTPAIDDVAVAAAMASWRADPAVAAWFTAGRGCVAACQDQALCQAGRRLGEEPAARQLAARLFHTTVAHPDGIDVIWPDAEAFVAGRVPAGTDPAALLPVFAGHALAGVTARWATQAGWSSPALARLDDLLRAVLAERVAGGGCWLGPTLARRALVAAAAQIQQRAYDPFPLCGVICPGGGCGYRHALLDAGMRGAVTEGPQGGTELSLDDMDTASRSALRVIQTAPPAHGGSTGLEAALNAARWQAVACAAQLLGCSGDRPRAGAQRVAAALTEAGWPMAVPGSTEADAAPVLDSGVPA
jgi:Helicase HerA, central domain